MKLTDEEVELFELAFLLRKPLYELLYEMSHEELMGWSEYFKLRPFGWRDDYRASQLLAASGAKFEVTKVFPSLAAIHKRNQEESLASALSGSHMHMLMMGAVGGEQPAFLQELA